MLIVAFIWIVFGGAAIGIGVEKEETWRAKLNVGATVDRVRRVLLIIGSVASAATILASFYFFVFKNALIILITWVVVFLLSRLFFEILLRRMIAEELPPPLSQTPRPAFDPSAEPQPQESHIDELRSEDDAEEIESNIEFAPVSPVRASNDDGIRSGWESANEAPAKPVPISHRDENVVAKPQIEMHEPRGNEYNDIFNRINKSGK